VARGVDITSSFIVIRQHCFSMVLVVIFIFYWPPAERLKP